jgi:hypothetical protein
MEESLVMTSTVPGLLASALRCTIDVGKNKTLAKEPRHTTHACFTSM